MHIKVTIFNIITIVSLCLSLTVAGQGEPITVYYDYVEDGQLKGGVLQLESNNAPASFVRRAQAQAASTWPVTTIIDSGPVSNRIDIVLVGDGYTASDLSGYASDANNVINGFFAEEPLDAYATYFNVHRVDVVSNESGVDEPDYGIYRDTALDMGYNCNGIARLLCVDVSAAWSAASSAPEAEQVMAMANSSRYGGAGYPSSDLATLAGKNVSAIGLALHEFAHSFANLADEYDYGGPTTYIGLEPNEANVSKYGATLLAAMQAKWYRWLDLPHIDSFEGAMYSQYGIYRPTSNSKMRSLGRPFEEVNVEQFVIFIYQTVSPADDASPVSGFPLPQDHLFYVIPLEPTDHALDIQWSVDSVDVPGANQPTFVADYASLSLGLHDIAVRVVDNTGRVRDESARTALMSFTRQWQIRVGAPGDFDEDCDVDQTDFGHLQACLTGTGIPVTDPNCQNADLDNDESIDHDDMQIFIGCVSGANVCGDIYCAN